MPSLLFIKDQFTAYIRIFTRYSAETLGMLKEIVHTNQKIYALLQQSCAFYKDVPRTPVAGDQITFIDVLGRSHLLDYCYFRYWNVFTTMLQCIFKGKPGETHVYYGQYLILHSGSGRSVTDSQQWERTVFPRSQLKMSVLLSQEGYNDDQCPRCDHVTLKKTCSSQTLVHW